MKFKGKLLSVLTSGLLMPTLTVTTLSSCGNNEQSNNVKITVTGVTGIILEKTETEKNKSLNITVNTPSGNYDILEVSSIKIGNVTLSASQYIFEPDSEAIYHLSIDGQYVTGNIEIQLASSPAVLFKTESSEAYKQYIALPSCIRMPKATEKTYSIKLSQKGKDANKQIKIVRAHYLNESGQDTPLTPGSDYTSTWNTANSCLDIIVKKEKVNWNIYFDAQAIDAELIFRLNHYIPDSAESPIQRSGLTVGDQPIKLDDEKEYSFEINTSDWGGEKYQELGSSWWFNFITATHGFHWFKGDATKVEINGKQLVKDKDFELLGEYDPETEKTYYSVIEGKGEYEKINWNSRIKITTVLDGDGQPEVLQDIYPSFFVFKPEPTGDQKEMTSFDEGLNGLICSTKKQVIKPNQTYSFKVDMKDWPEKSRPEDGVIWNFAFLDANTKLPLQIISFDRLTALVNEEELGPTEYELKNKSLVHGLTNYQKLTYNSIVEIQIGVILPEGTSEITCIPAFYQIK